MKSLSSESNPFNSFGNWFMMLSFRVALIESTVVTIAGSLRKLDFSFWRM